MCAAVVGSRKHLAPHGSDVDPHVAVRRDVVLVERAQERVDAEARVRVVRALGVVLVPRAVEHDELHVGELARHGDHVVGLIVRGVEVARAADPCAR